jgi:hypothetical protein
MISVLLFSRIPTLSERATTGVKPSKESYYWEKDEKERFHCMTLMQKKTSVPTGLFQEHRSPSKNRAEYPFDHAKLFFSFLSSLLNGEFFVA